MNKIKYIIRKWLGIVDDDERYKYLLSRMNSLQSHYDASIDLAVDVHWKSDTTIIIASKLGGGRVKIIEAKFETIQCLSNTIEHLERLYGTRAVIDAPPNCCLYPLKKGQDFY